MWKWLIALAAVLGGAFGIMQSFRANAEQAVPPLAQEPVRNPHERGIAGAGLVEPGSESVMVGAPEPGLVLKVYVVKGQQVKSGAPLFQLDTRALDARRVSLEAAVRAAEASLAAVKAYRRKEDEPLLLAKLKQAEAAVAQMAAGYDQARADRDLTEWNVKDMQDRERRLKDTVAGGASPETELERARFAVKMAEAQVAAAHEKVRGMEAQRQAMLAAVEQARAELNLYRAGPWEADVLKADAALAQARAQLESNRLDLERLTVRAPLDGEVLRLNLREGEYLTAGATRAESAPVVVGNLKDLHVRVDIDEFDAPRFKPGAKGTAFLKGASKEALPLEFVRIEPFVIPKRALTNSQNELVDTRVLQAVYRIKESKSALYVGQQMDVFVAAEVEAPATAATPAK